jgi:hypothetical protein
MAPSLKIETFEGDKKKGKIFRVSVSLCTYTNCQLAHTNRASIYGLPRVVVGMYCRRPHVRYVVHRRVKWVVCLLE